MAIDTNNPSQRTPCILILDTSDSMNTNESSVGTRIELLNDGLKTFHSSLVEDKLALARVQIAAVNAGGPIGTPKLFLDWTDANEFEAFNLRATGGTPLGQAVLVGLESLESHKKTLRDNGISYTRPWMIILTDGDPTDPSDIWRNACETLRTAEMGGKIEVFPIAIGNVSLDKLKELSQRPPINMSAVKFREFFVWLSSSLGQMTRSIPGAKIDLPSTDPWASVRL